MSQIIRIANVMRAADGTCRVAYYIADQIHETDWKTTPPEIGDVIEIDPKHPELGGALLGRPEAGALKPDSDALRWRLPVKASQISRYEVLRRRATIRRAVREYLDQSGYIEIDAPLLVRGTTPDPAVEAFAVDDRYLVTSTEFQMKRLAIGGFEKIYSLTQNFRRGDSGRFRNPEFTMLEWGQVGKGMPVIESDAEALTLAAIKALGLHEIITYQGLNIDMRRPWQRMTVSEAVKSITGADLPDFDLATCRKAVIAAGIEIRDDWADDRDFLFSLLMDTIQPQLGKERPVFLIEWPMFQTSSARVDSGRLLADRSELFIAGIEISDGFAALADVKMQEYLFGQAQAYRCTLGRTEVALDTKYLDAMRLGAPYGAGMALGFDRLVMLLTDQLDIRNTLAFAWDEL